MKRISAVVLGIVALLAVGVLAVHSKAQPAKDGAPDRSALRAQLVALRTEVSWMELEAEALRSFHQESVKSAHRDLAGKVEFLKGQFRTGLEGLRQKEGKERADELIKKEMSEKGIVPRPGEDEEAAIIRYTARQECGDILTELEREKADFLSRAKALEDKRLELTDVERQYREAR